MESGIKSSFIPHDTAQPSGKQRASSGSFLDLLVLISIVLFVASIALGVGVFLYQLYLETSSESKFAAIDRAKAAFDPALIEDLTRLDDRMHNADLILGKHIAPSVLFHLLEQMTLTTVSFRSLSLEAIDTQNISLKMDGIARSVNSVALQADLFTKNRIIISPIFSNIDRTQDGVNFNLSASVNPSALRYVQLVAADLPSSGQENQPESSFMPTSPLSPFEPQTGGGSDQ
ncbi:MAG TPA: hypothetical protein VJH69_02260 [Candidatus Paceibacterota bacterium]